MVITFFWFLGSVLAYLVIGLLIAAWDLPTLHQRIKDTPEYVNKSWQARAEQARGMAFVTVLFWPVRGPFLVIARLTDKKNPDVITRELQRREQAIADRELKIAETERRMNIGQGDATGYTATVWKDDLRPPGRKDDQCT